jgi:hypothetical protein
MFSRRSQRGLMTATPPDDGRLTRSEKVFCTMKEVDAVMKDLEHELQEVKGLVSSELSCIKEMLQTLLARQTVREFYSTDQFGELTGLKPKTVRDYCNEGRLRGEKKRSGRGGK